MWDKYKNKKNGVNTSNSYSPVEKSNNTQTSQTEYKPTPKPSYTPTYTRSGVTTTDVKNAIGYISSEYIGWPNMASSYVSSIWVSERTTDEFVITVEITVIMQTKLDSYEKSNKFERELKATLNNYSEKVDERLDPFAYKHGIDYEIEVKVASIS